MYCLGFSIDKTDQLPKSLAPTKISNIKTKTKGVTTAVKLLLTALVILNEVRAITPASVETA